MLRLPSRLPAAVQVLRALGLLPDDDIAQLEALAVEVEQVGVCCWVLFRV